MDERSAEMRGLLGEAGASGVKMLVGNIRTAQQALDKTQAAWETLRKEVTHIDAATPYDGVDPAELESVRKALELAGDILATGWSEASMQLRAVIRQVQSSTKGTELRKALATLLKPR